MHYTHPSRLSATLSLFFLCLLVGCGERSKDAALPTVIAREDNRAAAGAAQPKRNPNQITYDREAATLDAAIDDAVRLIDKQPDNTLIALETVSLYTERARLTGNYDDYRKAQSLLDAATARGNKASFPCLAHAKLHYTLHRLQAASAALDACPIMADPVEIAGLRGDIAFYSARYQEAEEVYRALVNQVGTTPQYFRLAMLRNKMGSPGEAAALLEAAEKRYHGGSATMKAWFKVQRGLIEWERGQIDQALVLYAFASDELEGWWLIDEQIAEAKRLKGDTAAAKALYESIIRRSGLPEHMDELARLLREGATPASATEWIKRAETLYRARLKLFPEASVGHAVDHFLQFGTPAEALALARRNAELRPYGDAQIALAAALFRAGQAGTAAECIARVEASGWNTAQLHAIAAQINAALGRNAAADAQRAKALQMNRHTMRLNTLTQPIQPELVSML
jgi:thioredoxin-like negative regulator of GroEL